MPELYTTTPRGESCDCPIHAQGCVPIVPYGIEIADRVTVQEVTPETAAAVYEAHHSYKPGIPEINVEHHGIYFDGRLVGAVTYRAPLLNKLKLWVTATGSLTRDSEHGVDSFMVNGGGVIEISRICIGVPLRNLASAGLARSMDAFLEGSGTRLGTRWLMTFIRVDHTGSMLRALLDKGWELVGISHPKEPGNRPTTEIHEWAKQRWLLPIEDYESRLDTRQAAIAPA